MSGRARRWYWLALAAAVALLAGGAVVAYRGYRATAGPAGAVRGYFAALQRGDAAAALAFGTVPAGRRMLLTGAVLREQQALGPLRGVTIERTSTSGARGTVRVRYDVGLAAAPEEVEDDVPVVRRRGVWFLAHTAVRTRIALGGSQDRAAVLGRPVPRGSLLVFPGAVPVRFDSPYLQFAPDAGVVTFTSGPASVFPVELSSAGKDAVMTAVESALRQCLSGAAPVDPRCPLPDDRYVPGSVRGRLVGDVVDAVRVDLQAGPSGLVAISGTVAAFASYRRLGYTNIARRGHGTVQLDVAASTYATRPLQLHWTRT